MTDLAAGSPVLSEDRPYPGLLSFRVEDENYFWGRATDVAALMRAIRHERVTVLFGRSGVGKSSILQAGLMPQAVQNGFLPVHVRIRWTRPGIDASTPPGSDELAQASAFVFGQILDPLRAAAVAAGLTERRAGPDPETLWAYLHSVELVDSAGNCVIPVLLLDQFEEFFRAPLNPAVRARLVDGLGDLLERYVPEGLSNDFDWGSPARQNLYRIVVCLREDFLPDLEQFANAMPSLSESRIRLSAMTRDQARAAITGPGAGVLSPGVDANILSFLSASAEGMSRPDSPIFEPVMLALVCYQLNELRIQRGESKVNPEVVASLGPQILRDFYDGAVSDPAARRFIEDELVTEGGLRRPVLESDATEVTPAELEQLVARRIVRRDSWNNQPCLELIHDRLCAPVQASREARARELARLEEVRARELARELARLEEKRVRKARILWVAGPLAFLAVLFATIRVQQAVKDRQAAEKQRVEREKALGERIKDEMAEHHLVRARLLALAALERFDLDESFRAHALWYQAMPRWAVEPIWAEGSPFNQFVKADPYYVTQAGDGRIVKISLQDGVSSEPRWLSAKGEVSGLTHLKASGTYVATSDVSGFVRVWSDMALVAEFPGPRRDVTALSLAVSDNSHCLAITHGQNHLEVFDLDTGNPLFNERLPTRGDATALALRASCSVVAVASAQGVRVIDIGSGEVHETPGTVAELAWFKGQLLFAGAVGLHTWTGDRLQPKALFTEPVQTLLANGDHVHWSSHDEEGSVIYRRSLEPNATHVQLARIPERVTEIQSCGSLLLLFGRLGSIYELNADCKTCPVTKLVEQEVPFVRGVGFCPNSKEIGAGFKRVVGLDKEGVLRQAQAPLLDVLLTDDVLDVRYLRERTIAVWTRRRRSEVRLLRGDETQLQGVETSWGTIVVHPRSDLVAKAASSDVTLHTPTEDGESITAASFSVQGDIAALRFSHAGDRLFVVGSDGALSTWTIGGPDPQRPVIEQISTGTPDTLPRVAEDAQGRLELSEDGKRGMYVAAGEIRVFTLPDATTLNTWKTIDPSHVWMAPTGGEVVMLGTDEVRVRDVESGDEDFHYPHPGVVGAAYSGSGRLLASFSSDGSIEVWNTSSRSRVRAYKHENAMPIRSLEFRPDERAFVAAGQEGRFLLHTLVGDDPAEFDMTTGEPVVAARWSPDGQRLLVASGRRVRLWELDPRRLKAQGCRQVSRALSKAEWNSFFSEPEPAEALCPGLGEGLPSTADFRRNIYCDVPLKCRVRRAFLKSFAADLVALKQEGTFNRVDGGWKLAMMRDNGILHLAGFQVGDTIVQINEVRFPGLDFVGAVGAVGSLLPTVPSMDRASIGFRRDGREQTLEVLALD